MKIMKIVAGLGNPGNEYNFTRHNVGFLTLDFYFKKKGLSWGSDFGAVIKREGDVIFVKPQDFYNLSGKAISEIARYYKVPAEQILVICDNFDLEFGKVRMRIKGEAGGNNGLKSVDAMLRTADYPRLRIGTGNDELRRRMGDVDFVLSKFTPEEKELLPGILNEACAKIEEFLG